MSKNKDYQPITYVIDDTTLEKLRYYAKKYKVSESRILNGAVKSGFDYIETQENKEGAIS